VNFMTASRRELLPLAVRTAPRKPGPQRPAKPAPAPQAPAPQSAAQPAPAVPAPAATDPDLLAAVDLGWCMAELYSSVRPGQLGPPDPPGAAVPPQAGHPAGAPRIQLQADLPGVGSLTDAQQFALQADEVNVGAHQLGPRITAAGLPVPVHEDWRALYQQRRSAEGHYQLARSVLQFHDELLAALTACDRQLGLAYGLGRATADLTLRFCADPAAASPAARQKTLTDDLRGGRVETIAGWLRELHTALPPHVAGAMTGSLRQWKLWAASPVWLGAPLDWAQHGTDVEQALIVQGKRWRLLLTGRADPLDQLSPDDYVQAAGFFVGRVRQILHQLIVQYWPWVTLATLAMAGAVAGSLVLLNSPAAKGIGVAVSVFGWLGITGRSLWGALRRTVSHVEYSLWEAELDLAAAWANTTLPDADANRQLREAAPPGAALMRARRATAALPRPRRAPRQPPA
jgi:hypothetical protein